MLMLTRSFMIKYFKKSMNMKFVHSFPRNILGLFLGAIAIMITSCENDPSALGSNLLPGNIEYIYDTTLTFKASVFEDEPSNTSNFQFYSLGVIDDEYFGNFTGKFVGQFLPSKYYDTDSTVSTFDIDSAVIYLLIDSIYGSQNSGLKLNAYELNNDIDRDDNYNSDEDLSNFYLESDLISTGSKIQGDSLIRIKLSSEYANKLIPEDYNDTIYKNSTNFLDFFKGIAIVPEITNSPGELVVTNFSNTDSKIVMYYNDTLTFNHYFLYGARFGNYTNDYSISTANDFLINSDNENDSLIFLQGIHGLSSSLTFEDLDTWIDNDSAYSVINAELFIPVYKDPNYELFNPPTNLYMYYEPNDTTNVLINDYADFLYNKGFFDGSYDSENGYYRFFIPKHLMSILNQDIAIQTINLTINKKTTYPNRVILKTGDNIKLKVTYTKH